MTKKYWYIKHIATQQILADYIFATKEEVEKQYNNLTEKDKYSIEVAKLF